MIFTNIWHEPWKKKMHLWELDDNGKTNHLVFDHEIEYYVEDKTGKSPIKSIDGISVVKKTSANKEAIKILKQSGERIFESDLSEEVKFLHKRYGDNNDDGIKFENIKIFNIDIETEFPDSERINLIGIQNFHTGEIFQFGLYDYKGKIENATYIHCPTEELLLERFCKFIKFMGVSVFIGWNIKEFDIPKIQERIDYLQLKCSMSPIGKVYRDTFNKTIKIAGIDILDSMLFYKKFTQKNEPSFSLDYIGNLVVGEGKVGYEGTLSDFWKTDPDNFVLYNCQDLNLVKKIDNVTKFTELAIMLGITTRTPFEKIESSVATIEGYILRYLHKNNMVMEDVTHNIAYEKTRSVEGGYVMAKPGFYTKAASEDVESMYPHLIMMFNISKETKVLNPSDEDIPNLIKSPVQGVYYKKDFTGILSVISKTLFDSRKNYKKLMFKYKKEKDPIKADYYNMLQKVEKTKIVSIYGCCLEPHFHWYDYDNGAVITAGGRSAIQYMSKKTNEYFRNEFCDVAKNYYPNSKLTSKCIKRDIVVYNDTDSFYLTLDVLFDRLNTNLSYFDFCLDFEKRVLEPFIDKSMNEFADQYNTKNLLRFKREKIITKYYIQAKKKYATLSLANEDEVYSKPEFSITGLETKKSDLCKFSRKHLAELVSIMFAGDSETLPNKDNMLNHIRQGYKEFQKQPISDIALPKSVGTYDKYDTEISVGQIHFEKGTPIYNKASMVYNLIIKDLNLPYTEIKNEGKMKYVFVNPNNKYQTPVVAFVGHWPKEFNDIFKLDYDMIFEKQYLNVAQRIFDTLGFGKIVLKESKLSRLIDD